MKKIILDQKETRVSNWVEVSRIYGNIEIPLFNLLAHIGINWIIRENLISIFYSEEKLIFFSICYIQIVIASSVDEGFQGVVVYRILGTIVYYIGLVHMNFVVRIAVNEKIINLAIEVKGKNIETVDLIITKQGIKMNLDKIIWVLKLEIYFNINLKIVRVNNVLISDLLNHREGNKNSLVTSEENISILGADIIYGIWNWIIHLYNVIEILKIIVDKKIMNVVGRAIIANI